MQKYSKYILLMLAGIGIFWLFNFCVMLSAKGSTGLTVLQMYLWSQGKAVANEIKPWATIIAVIASIGSFIVNVIPDKDFDDESQRKRLRFYFPLVMITGWLTAIACVMMPTVETLNYIHSFFK